ncbi:MAG: hypothetical protein OHK0046_12890 [Anaerolineae bacterium]
MLDLLDYRRRIHAMYSVIREQQGSAAAFAYFKQTRDDLFRHHAQSALDDAQKAAFTGLPYFDYNPAYRVTAVLDRQVEQAQFVVDLDEDGRFTYQRIGQVHFTLPSGTGTLNVYWIEGYGGGIFLPFGDATNKHTTYGAGRYLFDTIKGADLGTVGDEMILDFNFAYHPSCAYNVRWVCPLAAQENKLPFPIEAGERL